MTEKEAPKKVEVVPVAPAGEPAAAPMSAEEFTVALDQLVQRAKVAGVRPLQVMVRSYLKQGVAVIDGVLGSLEGGPPTPPAQKQSAPESTPKQQP